MKKYSYLIIVLVLLSFGYLAMIDWNSRPKLVILFGLLTVLILFREIKEIRK